MLYNKFNYININCSVIFEESGREKNLIIDILTLIPIADRLEKVITRHYNKYEKVVINSVMIDENYIIYLVKNRYGILYLTNEIIYHKFSSNHILSSAYIY